MSKPDEPISQADTLPAPAETAPTLPPPIPDDGFAKPKSFFVKVYGGTTTSDYDARLAAKVADADERRRQDDNDRKLSGISIEQGGAISFEKKMADALESPRVLIQYVGRGGKDRRVLMDQLCELVFDDISSDNLFIFVCPECFGRGIPSQFAQCHIRSSHRQWHIDKREGGQIRSVRNSDEQGGMEFYTTAGRIMDTERFGCDHENCGCHFKIHNNIMYRVD